MESKPEFPEDRPPSSGSAPPTAESIRGALLRLAVAHNRAVLAAVVFALAASIALCGTALLLIHSLRLFAVPVLIVGLGIGWKGVRVHGRMITDIGPGRAAAVKLAATLLARGGHAPVAEIQPAFSRDDLYRALDFLDRMRLAWAEPREGGDHFVIDAERLRALLDPS